MENDLNASKNIQDPVKREYDAQSTLFSTTPSATNASKNSRKKPKKKKKRPRHQKTLTTIVTTTAIPETSPSLTTMETWLTTSQWQLVAERLFRPPWQQNMHKERENVAKSRTNEITLKPHPSVWEFAEQSKPRNTVKPTNTERTPVLLDFSRESNAQSRSPSFEKINAHQPLRLHDSREMASFYDQPTGKSNLNMK